MASRPLAAHHIVANVPLTTLAEAEVPAVFSDLASELAAVRDGAALFDLAWLGHVVVTGRHRARFVHNMTTCDIKGLTPGRANFGMVVNALGRLVAQFHVDAEDDSLVLEVTRTDRDATVAQLVKYRVADDVQFTPDDDRHVLTLAGPTAANVLGHPLPDTDHSWIDRDIDGVPARIRRTPARLAVTQYDITVASDAAPAVWEHLTRRGATAAGANAWEIARVQALWPRDGVDMGGDNVPLESDRLYATVDWDKGCYIGQEVIAMMHYRGRPNKHLRMIALPNDADVAVGTPLTVGDKTIGSTGTVVAPPGTSARLALAVLKRKHADAGTRVTLPDGSHATVLAPPSPID